MPRRIFAHANAVRELGNVGTHAFERVTPKDVVQSLSHLLEIVDWFFEQSDDAPRERARPDDTPDDSAPITPPKTSLGHELIPLPGPPPAAGAATTLLVSATCICNADYLEFVRAGGPAPRGSPSTPARRSWQGKRCPESVLDHPVLYVSQSDARRFCSWLTERERRDRRIGKGQAYTLPTFEQWKVFAEGERVPKDAVTDGVWASGSLQPTVPVTWGEPSRLGLYHLFGNAFQWCLDESENGGEVRHLAVGGGWASARGWLEQEVRQGTYGSVWRRKGLPMKDGGFRVCLTGPAAGPGGT
jgi:hypothetical protein